MHKSYVNIVHELKIFLWAAMHSGGFNNCIVRLPISLQFHSTNFNFCHNFSVVVTFRAGVFIYIPSDILFEYLIAHDVHQYEEFPF